MRKRQNRVWATSQNRKEMEQKEGRKQKESEMNGKGMRRERGSQEEGIRGQQSSVKTHL